MECLIVNIFHCLRSIIHIIPFLLINDLMSIERMIACTLVFFVLVEACAHVYACCAYMHVYMCVHVCVCTCVCMYACVCLSYVYGFNA